MPCTEEQKLYARLRYAERCKDPEYRKKVNGWGRAAHHRKREKMLEAGAVLRSVGRPRKYDAVTPEMQAVVSGYGLTMDAFVKMLMEIEEKVNNNE